MWSPADLDWLALNYPALHEKKPGTIEGSLTFRMVRISDEYTVNPSPELTATLNSPDFLYIEDTYEVRLTWPDGEDYPIAHETGKRLAEVAQRFNKNLLDMHQYDQTEALCLASDMAIERAFRAGFKLDIFVEELLIPYLFAQSHFAKTGIWLWGELSHGYIGTLEWLARQNNVSHDDIKATHDSLVRQIGNIQAATLLSKRWRAHFKCLCGSSVQTRQCHPEVQGALGLLRNME